MSSGGREPLLPRLIGCCDICTCSCVHLESWWKISDNVRVVGDRNFFMDFGSTPDELAHGWQGGPTDERIGRMSLKLGEQTKVPRPGFFDVQNGKPSTFTVESQQPRQTRDQ